MTFTANNNFAPLTDAELDELDQFLLKEVDDDKAMLLDTLDGYLHAIAVGPTTIAVSEWMPAIWGSAGTVMPSDKSTAPINYFLSLIMRHFNDILGIFNRKPVELCTIWGVEVYRGREYADAEAWAKGFVGGMKLCWNEWMPLLETPEGQACFRPIGLLGEFGCSAEQDLTSTPEKRDELAQQIPDAVLAMQQHWLPYRRAVVPVE